MFSDPQAVARYAENPPRVVPGFADLHPMAMLLVKEQAPIDAQVLVLGAGGGLELKAFAEAQPGWSFVGVDPAGAMLDLARANLGDLVARTRLHEGYIDSAPKGPFDGATCILILHFVEQSERLRTLKAVQHRLKPGEPFVAAHYSIPQGELDFGFPAMLPSRSPLASPPHRRKPHAQLSPSDCRYSLPKRMSSYCETQDLVA